MLRSGRLDGHPPVLFAKFKSDVKRCANVALFITITMFSLSTRKIYGIPLPFEPTIRKMVKFMQGARKTIKGQLFLRGCYIEAFSKKSKRLPL